MNDILKKLGYKTMSGKWDIAEIKVDIIAVAIMGLVIYVAILLK